MGSDMKDKIGAKGRGDAWRFAPEDLVIVTDPKHPLFDERALKAPSPSFVKNIERFGIKTPIQIRNNGKDDAGKPVIEVVDGRQRVMAARMVNEANGWTDDQKMLVPCVMWRGEDKDTALTMVFLNEARKDDDVWVKALKAKRLLDMGHDEESIAVTFSRNVATVKRWLALFDCSAEVQAAVQNEGMSIDAALKLAAEGLTREKQTEALAAMREAGTLVGAAAVEEAEKQATKGKGGKKKKKQMRSLKYKEIETKKQEILKQPKRSRYWEGVVAGLAFAQGEKATKAFEDAPGGD